MSASGRPPDPEAAISLRGVTKSFGDLHVLKGVDLDVFPAENVVVLGRSGTGKSVLIKILVGLLTPDEGTVMVLGQEVPKLPRKELDALRRRVGFSFQGSALYDSMTVAENLEFPLRMNLPELSRADIEERVRAALDDVGLAQSYGQMPAELSGGQRKRIGIARTLILRPEIMLYDEPTAGLDPVTCTEINDLMNEVQETHHTASIIITHDLTCARQTGDRVAMLLDGQMERVGSFDEVFDSDDPRVRGFYDYNFTERDQP
ncbi:MAG: ATP-binding cassette domain-containing protein [Alphaproteobacteria bacterium]|nr:ATP-binding cassette domain-containing protein [Alphaproteobacteria bacterium]